MSIDIDFWKYKDGVKLNHADVYKRACCDNEYVEGLERLPVEEIRKKIAFEFKDWTALDNDNYEKDGSSFAITTTNQMVRFDFYTIDRSDMNRIIEIMLSYGCALYEPQIGARFDYGMKS